MREIMDYLGVSFALYATYSFCRTNNRNARRSRDYGPDAGAHACALSPRLRLHNTDGRDSVVRRSRTGARERSVLHLVSDEHRLALQQRANEMRDAFDDFRVRMCQL